MGEARRKKMLGNTEPSNPNWKRRTRKLTRREEAEIQQEVMGNVLGVIGQYPRLIEMISRRTGGLR